MTTLFTPLKAGDLVCPNRIVMAPLTRCRAGAEHEPVAVHAEYYRQRASAGLIVSEATQISPMGVGYLGTPGIHSTKQIAGWKRVTEAVHAAGGRMVLQLWHVGRISHPDLLGGALPVSASDVKPEGEVYTPAGRKPYVVPRALMTEEIPSIVEEYRTAAVNAREAGFDGVEIHGANGYLIDQFLRNGSNRRTDEYGGTIENRARFALEVLDAVISVWGSARIGYRMSPNGRFNDMHDDAPEKTFGYLASAINQRKIAYLHVIRRMAGDVERIPLSFFRERFSGALISNGEFSPEEAEHMVNSGVIDAVAFGKLFISNPDLPARIRNKGPYQEWDAQTFYQGGERGYTDYPALGGSTGAS